MFYCALFSKLIPLDDPDIYDKSTFYVVRIERLQKFDENGGILPENGGMLPESLLNTRK